MSDDRSPRVHKGETFSSRRNVRNCHSPNVDTEVIRSMASFQKRKHTIRFQQIGCVAQGKIQIVHLRLSAGLLWNILQAHNHKGGVLGCVLRPKHSVNPVHVPTHQTSTMQGQSVGCSWCKSLTAWILLDPNPASCRSSNIDTLSTLWRTRPDKHAASQKGRNVVLAV